MRLFATSGFTAERSDIPELQDVLTRCIDSVQDYARAAEAAACPDLAAMLAGTAERRGEAVQELAGFIRGEGVTPREGPSLVGTLRRGCQIFLPKLAGAVPASRVAACLRGEQVLLRSLERALDSQEVTCGHAAAIRITRQEVTSTIGRLQTLQGRPASPKPGEQGVLAGN